MTDPRFGPFSETSAERSFYSPLFGGPSIRRTATLLSTTAFILTAPLTHSCSTLTKTMSTTSTLGLGLGFAIGLGGEPRRQYAGAGAAAGAAIGLLAGYFLHQHIVEREDQVRQETIFSIEKIGIESEAIRDYEGHQP